MKVIRDEECSGLFMIPLFVDWNIKRCNVTNCKAKPSTIITRAGEDNINFALCEDHYQEGNTEGGTKFTLEFDEFDAFKYQEEKTLDGHDK